MQMAVGVRSGINLVLFQDNFSQYVTTEWMTNLQIEIMSETYCIFTMVFPMMIALLNDHWNKLFEEKQQQDRKLELYYKRIEAVELQKQTK